jgi:hypothetical protein
VALLLDLDRGVVRYGDPASASAPIDLVEMVQWRLDQHHWSSDVPALAWRPKPAKAGREKPGQAGLFAWLSKACGPGSDF